MSHFRRKVVLLYGELMESEDRYVSGQVNGRHIRSSAELARQKRRRHSKAEIAIKLREAGTLAAAGQPQAEIAKVLGVSVMTIHRWRTAQLSCPSLLVAPARDFWPSEHLDRIAELQLENSRLKRILIHLLLEKMRLEDGAREEEVSTPILAKRSNGRDYLSSRR